MAMAILVIHIHITEIIMVIRVIQDIQIAVIHIMVDIQTVIHIAAIRTMDKSV